MKTSSLMSCRTRTATKTGTGTEIDSAVIYLRVSSRKQSGPEHVSLPVQEERCLEFCRRHGLSVVQTYSEVGSAREQQKLPLLRQAIKLASSLPAHLVVYKVCRFARNALDGLSAMKKIMDAGACVLSATEEFDPRSVSGRHSMTILLAASEHESGLIGERVRAALARLRARGSKMGRARYGSRIEIDPVTRLRRALPDAHERAVEKFVRGCRAPRTKVPVLRVLLSMFAEEPDSLEVLDERGLPSNVLKSPLTYANIAEVLNDFGVSKRGKEWTAGSVRSICQLPSLAGLSI
ncbi:MAG: recombinase family protein [Sulfobacillus sp.]